MDYKDTLLLPKTDFEMRGNLNKKEPGIQAHWDEINLYEKMLEKREGAELFVLHDGPPYANGNIHVGHALNGILKDMVIRSQFLLGKKTPYRPGWDTHGLPIETAVQKQGVDRKSIPPHEFRRICEAYAREQVALQMKDFKSLGKIGDYNNPYITLNKDYEAAQVRVFAQMALKGMIFRGLKPVHWSPSSETALAEAELEYYDRKDPAIYVSFNVVDGKGVLDTDDKLLIWTTTPWTIPANLAIAVNPEMEYVLVKTHKGNLVIMKSLLDNVLESLELENEGILKTFKGSDIENVTYKHPLYDRVSPVILGDHVTDEAGTGNVHTAPDHGVEDFEAARKYGIKPMAPVDEKGHLNEKTGEFEGLYFEKANKEVTVRLEEENALLKLDWITHSYAHDWRTKKPIIYRATTQWFASIDSIRDTILDEITKVTWYPSWGEKRMHNMMKDRGDWTISRQRVWGVPIPIIYAEDGTPIIEEELFEHFANLFAQYGSNIWFEKEVYDLLPEGYTHPNSPNGIFTKEKDIMDVWFDSGSSHTAALDHNETPLPVDVYLEGTDQYRGWFNSSLILSVAVNGKAPYKNVVTNGFVKLSSGEKMSKSKSNGLLPNEITSTYGADILRLWVASVDYQSDVPIAHDLFKQVSESYRKIRNTFRFMLGNLNDFTDDKKVPFNELSVINKYVVDEINKINKQAQMAYNNFDFQKVTNSVLNSMTNLLSAYFLDYTKDILYLDGKDDRKRREVVTVIDYAVNVYSKLLAPILVHTMEELYQTNNPKELSIHLEDFVPVQDNLLTENEAEDMSKLFTLREDVYKALEEKRADKVIGKSLEADVTIQLDDELYDIVENVLGNDLAQWLIVSKATPTKGDYSIMVEKANGSVCPRCWNIVENVDEDGLCSRCHNVIHHD